MVCAENGWIFAENGLLGFPAGIGIFVRDDIKHGVVIWRNTKDVVAWIQLKAEYFGLKRDLYVANIYMVPQGSVHVRDDIFSLLYGDLAQLPPESHVLLCGY